jgi:hypothetical protein
VRNAMNHIKLYVKLARCTDWFGSHHINKSIRLRRLDSNEVFIVILKSTDRADQRSATGSVFVKGLSKQYCNALLNK